MQSSQQAAYHYTADPLSQTTIRTQAAGFSSSPSTTEVSLCICSLFALSFHISRRHCFCQDVFVFGRTVFVSIHPFSASYLADPLGLSALSIQTSPDRVPLAISTAILGLLRLFFSFWPPEAYPRSHGILLLIGRRNQFIFSYRLLLSSSRVWLRPIRQRGTICIWQ